MHQSFDPVFLSVVKMKIDVNSARHFAATCCEELQGNSKACARLRV